jgi:preprotein translocase subunit SecG
MIYAFLLAVLVLDGLLLGLVILLQSGKGGGLAAVGGGAAMTEGILGGRQATTFLTRTTWITGTIFLVLALVLAIMSSRSAQPESILRDAVPESAPAPAPLLPGAEEPPATTGGGEIPPPGGSEEPGGEGS